MTESEFDKLMMDFTNEQIKLLEKLLASSIDDLSDLLLAELKKPDLTGQRLEQVYEAYDQLDAVYATYITKAINQSYKTTISAVYDLLNDVGNNKVDAKLVNTLIKDAIHDFTSATENGRRVAAFYFKISKQELITESQISQAVGQSLLTDGYGYDAKIAVRELLKTRQPVIYDKNALMKRISKDVKDDLRKIKKNLRDDYMQVAYNQAYAEKKYLQIINKNGDIMNFQVDTYAALVSRSRIGDSQVQGAIEVGNNMGAEFFKVTSHNTQTPICKPHESKTYTTSKDIASLGVWQYLNDKNRPIYHPNCQHRLVPIVYSNSQIIRLAKTKGVSDNELQRVLG